MKKTVLVAFALFFVAFAGSAQHHVRVGANYGLPVGGYDGLHVSTQYEYEILKFLSVGTGLSYGSGINYGCYSTLTMLDLQLGFSPLNTEKHRLMIGLGASGTCDKVLNVTGSAQQLSVAALGQIMYEYTLPCNIALSTHLRANVGSFYGSSLRMMLGMSVGYKF